MKITILLPVYRNDPVGGFKVQYEYANRLTARGHEVTIALPRNPFPQFGLVEGVKARVWPHKVRRQNRPLVSWFPLDPRVRLLLPRDLRPRFIPPGDVLIATSWETAEMALGYPADRGTRFYMVYDYERWMTASDDQRRRMGATYRPEFQIIATSPAVREMLATYRATPAAYIPCGIDLSNYRLDVPFAGRPWGRIGFPVRVEADKGTPDAVAALTALRERHGDALQVVAFGSSREFPLPPWVEYHYKPTDTALRAFYNSLSVFLFPSHYEGWGLTGTEALACGAALAASDSVGLRDYAIDGETALLVPPKRPDLLAEAVERLLADEPLRLRLAAAGNAQVQRYTWDRAVDAFETLLPAAAERSPAALAG